MTDTTDELWDASEALKQITLRHVVPVLEPLGFRGKSRRFVLKRGAIHGIIEVKQSRWNSRESKDFTYSLSVTQDDLTIWSSPISFLLPDPSKNWWSVSGWGDVEPVGQQVAVSLRDYGCTAISVVMEDDPGLADEPQDIRSFPEMPIDYGRSIEEKMEDEQRNRDLANSSESWTFDEAMINSVSQSRARRNLARNQLVRRWPSHPATIDLMLSSLETEDSVETRRWIATRLGFCPESIKIDCALEDAAFADEAPVVRWAARYALRIRRGTEAA